MLIAQIASAVAVAAAVGGSAAFASVPAPKPGTDTSTNWAGYVVTDTTAVPVAFTAVTATWRQPVLKCGRHDATSAIWVGLGGLDPASGLEQLGTSADCTKGKSRHGVFYEVIPAPAVHVNQLKISAGDTITASVIVEGARRVRFRIENLTTRRGFTVVVQVARGVRRSAEWIIEAPAGCAGTYCGQTDLANFRSVQFTNAAAIGNGHTGTILDPNWHATAVSLTPSRRQIAATGRSYGAVPRALAPHGSSFRIVWRSRSAAPSFPAPMPAKPGGPYIAGPRLPAAPAG